jgi:iron complex transport system substrate-binding protein
MRIVSLLPSATEIVCALGLRDELVGISHCCDYPPESEGVPVVTRPRHADRGHSPDAFVDNEIGPSDLDVDALRATQPDLVIVRDAVNGSGIGSRAVRDALGAAAEDTMVISLDPVSVEGIFHSITTIGAMVEAEDDAMELLEALREELGDLEQHVLVRQDEGIQAPRVVMLQGLEPPFASGRWLPEQVRRAGGWDLLGHEGEAASPIDWEMVRDVDPEMLLMAPIGMHLPAAKRAFGRLQLPEFWHDMGAVRRGRVFLVEPVYFERPGPRIVDGVGMLAEIFDSDGFVETSPPGSWTPVME